MGAEFRWHAWGAVTSRMIATCLALWAATPALAQPIPPPRGSVSSDGDYAYSGSFTYDPSTCSRDPKGMVYFAVGRRVLRQPLENLGYMTGMNAADRRAMPHVRHPEEPVGCPDHPIQMAAYDLWHISSMPGNVPNMAAADADKINLIIHGRDTPYRQNDLFELMCRTHKLRDESVPGFVGCKKPYRCNEDVTYQANEYTEPDGTKIALHCTVSLDCTPRLATCFGGYLLREHLTVNFKFAPSVLPIERFPAADQEMQRRLEAAEVRDFEWTQAPAGNTLGDKQ